MLSRCFLLCRQWFCWNNEQHKPWLLSTVSLRLRCTTKKTVAYVSDRLWITLSLITSFNDHFVSLSTCDVILTINLLPCHSILACSVSISELLSICIRCLLCHFWCCCSSFCYCCVTASAVALQQYYVCYFDKCMQTSAA